MPICQNSLFPKTFLSDCHPFNSVLDSAVLSVTTAAAEASLPSSIFPSTNCRLRQPTAMAKAPTAATTEPTRQSALQLEDFKIAPPMVLATRVPDTLAMPNEAIPLAIIAGLLPYTVPITWQMEIHWMLDKNSYPTTNGPIHAMDGANDIMNASPESIDRYRKDDRCPPIAWQTNPLMILPMNPPSGAAAAAPATKVARVAGVAAARKSDATAGTTTTGKLTTSMLQKYVMNTDKSNAEKLDCLSALSP
mmetsp:Transcript_20014/g.56729  ORF Transcript_20014/g.56729 Transcript_20014/m.56729 type:complete len:249 (-) Transcript_20014:544-1290(-)